MPFVSQVQDGFFRGGLTQRDFDFDWRKFIAAIKEYLPADQRDYDEDAREWVFDEKNRQAIMVLMRQYFPGQEIDQL